MRMNGEKPKLEIKKVSNGIKMLSNTDFDKGTSYSL